MVVGRVLTGGADATGRLGGWLPFVARSVLGHTGMRL
jgi:hypothetical protein